MADKQELHAIMCSVPKVPREVSDILDTVKQKMLEKYYENVINELSPEQRVNRELCNDIFIAVAIGSWEIEK